VYHFHLLINSTFDLVIYENLTVLFFKVQHFALSHKTNSKASITTNIVCHILFASPNRCVCVSLSLSPSVTFYLRDPQSIHQKLEMSSFSSPFSSFTDHGCSTRPYWMDVISSQNRWAIGPIEFPFGSSMSCPM